MDNGRFHRDGRCGPGRLQIGFIARGRAEVRKKREVCVVTAQGSPHANTGHGINGKGDLDSCLLIPQLTIICSPNPPYQTPLQPA